MIKLFMTDLDGCISHPFISPNWQAIQEIRKLNQASKEERIIPPLTICSGRPFPYVEAVAQWLDVRKPMLFESGAGMYEFEGNRLNWNPFFDEKAEKQVNEIKKWLKEDIIPEYPETIAEFAKHTDAGIINPDKNVVQDIYDRVLDRIENQYPDFEVHITDVSVNIILKKANKGEGIRFICKYLDLDPKEVAYIGDSSGDVPAFKVVGKSFAPESAREIAREHAEIITGPDTQGVLEAYHQLIEFNKGNRDL